ncbi:hypothetical protein CK203_045995 [Vitis vinifera]|uniref:Uncharacterized protein n=1 Tax=Vitis vinifera TaxID=29760 RepID=A0A438HGY8_VITVI|nr:hypothetical protein CK203_045995 [Vitis vinifera]
MGGSYWAHSFIVLAAAAPSTCKIFKCQFSGVQRISRFAGRFTFKVRGTALLFILLQRHKKLWGVVKPLESLQPYANPEVAILWYCFDDTKILYEFLHGMLADSSLGKRLKELQPLVIEL